MVGPFEMNHFSFSNCHVVCAFVSDCNMNCHKCLQKDHSILGVLMEGSPPLSGHGTVELGSVGVHFCIQLENQHLIHQCGHQPKIPWDWHTFEFHQWVAPEPSGLSNGLQAGHSNGTNIGHPPFQSWGILLPKSFAVPQDRVRG